MPPELHLDPDRLHAHALAAAGLSEDLRAVLPGRVAPALPPEADGLRTAVARAVRELSELSAALAGAAAAAQVADAEAAHAFGPRRERT